MSKNPEMCAKLRMSLYGTRDAGANWHKAYSLFLKSIGFAQAVSNPCHFSALGMGMKGLVHGDDFMFTGSRKNIEWLQKKFELQYDCKIEKIGRAPELPKSARFLNRVVSFTEQGLEMEADQRLVEGIVHGMGVKDSNAASSPGTKSKPITKEAHRDMMARRLCDKAADSEEIVKLQSQIEKLNGEISDLHSRLKESHAIDTTTGRMSIDLWPFEGVGTTGGGTSLTSGAVTLKTDLGTSHSLREKVPEDTAAKERAQAPSEGTRGSPTRKAARG